MRINSFTEPESLLKDTVTLSPDESHHLARVLRVEAGQEMTLFDGLGTLAEGVIETVTKKEVTVRITSRKTVPPPAVEITLIQAVCKPDRFELILQKATELGVRRIQPVISRHTVNRSKEPEKQLERWKTIVRNAAQQCGTAWLPEIQPVEPFATIVTTLGKNQQALTQSVPMSGKSGLEILPSKHPSPNCRAGTAESLPAEAGRSMTIPALQPFDMVFIGSLHPNAKPFREAFRSSPASAGWKPAIRTAGFQPALRAALLIGPEGDFTQEEVDAAVAAGALPVTFGSQILRTETAAIFGLSVLVYELF